MNEGTVQFEFGGHTEESKREQFNEFMQEDEIKLLMKDFKGIEEFLSELRGDMSNWIKFSDKKTSKIYYR